VWTGSRKCLGSEFHVARPATDVVGKEFHTLIIVHAEKWKNYVEKVRFKVTF